ncbi:MAG: EF-P beta-lysylation protein EpmB [Gammaproteobacteria bacterium]|nr:EF-P beta-lysylation protein EpmB [Gammaproteobacteria bacterium]
MITNLKKLSQLLHLDLANQSVYDQLQDFPLLVPKSFAAKIKPNDKNDPLLLQVLPQKSELETVPGFGIDPIWEREHSPVTGLIHKYHGRVLLLATNICAVNCRFCFRRHLQEKITDWQKVFSYIKDDPSINEVILSGGDPLMLKPKELQNIMDRLAVIPHVKRIRIHSRVPIVMPERITAKLIKSKIPVVLVVHCNHSNEISPAVVKALKLLCQQNITIFNQSVLLKGVNDSSQTLIALSERLFDAGVTPYYLHILDKVKGAAHFYVDIKRAKRIYLEMQKKLSGYLMPKLVVEVKGRKKHL